MTDTDRMLVWLRETMDAQEALARRVAARYVYADAEHVEPERRGKPFWPLESVRARYKQVATGKFDDPDLYAGLTLIEANSPAAVLRRIAADRKILDEHAENPYDLGYCRTCTEHEDGWAVPVAAGHPCPTIRNLAEGWGWTEETTT